MAFSKGKTERGSHKEAGRKNDFIGYRTEAKAISKRVRRMVDKRLAWEAKTNPTDKET